MPRHRVDRSRRPATVVGGLGVLVGGGLIALNVANPPVDWLGVVVSGVIVLAGLAAAAAALRA